LFDPSKRARKEKTTIMKRLKRLSPVKRFAVALAISAIVFGAVFAVAASLGVTSDTLGAGGASVVSCDTDGVTTSYAVGYDSSIPGYKVSSVTVNGIDGTACNGKTMRVTLTGTSNASLAERTATLGSGSSQDFDFSAGAGSPVSAAAVLGVRAVISG
jgi:hypothetical protein